MRCQQCNVDVAEGLGSCPLCGASVSDEAPVLGGIATARYPKKPVIVKKEFPVIPVFLGALLLAAVISAVVESLVTGTFTLRIAAGVFFGGCCLCAVLLRPMTVSRLPLGNYLFAIVISVSAFVIYYLTFFSEALLWGISVLVPMFFVFGMAIMTVISLFSSSRFVFSSVHILMLMAVLVVYSIVALAVDGIKPLLPLLALAFGAVCQLIIFFNKPKEWLTDLKARFHI